ncbi:putative reverse transcriptase domain-containing protein [Tanacetum coccineum]
MPKPLEPDIPADHEPEAEAATVSPRRLVPLTGRRFFINTQVWIGSSSFADAVHDPEDLTPTHIRSDLNALHRRVPYDPATDPVMRARSDDPYVMARDAATVPAAIGATWIPTNMPPKDMSQAAIERLITQRFDAGLTADRAGRNTVGGSGGNVGGKGGQGEAPPVRECSFTGYMKCNPTSFHGNKGAVELCRWFEKTESVFSISECAERNKVKFAAATLQGRDLTWWNSQVATLVLEVANGKSWTGNCKLRTKELPREIKGDGKTHKVGNARAMTTAQNEGVDQGGPTSKCNSCGICHFGQCPPKCNKCGKIGHKARDYRGKAVASGANAQPIKAYYECGDKDAKHNQGPNVVTSTFLLNNRYANVLFDSGSDKSFVNTSFSRLIDINPVKLNTSYEVKLADGKIVSTNTVLRGCTLNLIDHLFEIDLMPIELGTFDVIIRMDWLVERDAIIVYGKKVVHIPYKNKMLVVKGDRGTSRLKVISRIKTRKYIERGCHLFLAHVTEKEPAEKRLEDVSVIRDFPKVFLDDLSGLPPPRQVEFKN